MKEFFIITIIVLLTFIASIFSFAEEPMWYTANEKTVEWDAVTETVDGDPIPADQTVKYFVYLVNAITDPNKTELIRVGSTKTLSKTITLDTVGRFFVGVKAVTMSGEDIVGESVVAWSDDSQYVSEDGIFGLQCFSSPTAVKRLRIK